jgi:hypothetical protein
MPEHRRTGKAFGMAAFGVPVKADGSVTGRWRAPPQLDRDG